MSENYTTLTFFLTILIVSCNVQSDTHADNQPLSTTKYKPDAFKLADSHIRMKVFQTGRSFDFTDSCTFFFECDCCAGDLVFSPDSMFYSVSYCMGDQGFRTGIYEIKNETVVLNFNSTCVNKIYNWDHEFDTTAVEYFLTDTSVSTCTIVYCATLCNGKIKIEDKERNEVAISTESNYSEFIESITEDGIFELLNE